MLFDPDGNRPLHDDRPAAARGRRATRRYPHGTTRMAGSGELSVQYRRGTDPRCL